MPAFKNLLEKSYKELKSPRSLTAASLLVAIYAISYYPAVGRFMIIPGFIEIRFGFIVLAVAGALFGPFMAMVVAFLGDITGVLLFSGASFFWGFTINWMVLAFVFGLCFYKEKITLPRIVCAMLFNTCAISSLLTPLMLQMISGRPFQEWFFLRLPLNAIMLPVNIVLLYLALRTVCSVYDRVLASHR